MLENKGRAVASGLYSFIIAGSSGHIFIHDVAATSEHIVESKSVFRQRFDCKDFIRGSVKQSFV
ncbi:MAG: hypothetical protein A4E66_01910 [Syntrophus sp. PtaB.Bin001]|nr:MAG: hypothetical protein A4E66_01910 [Syntrophus sp. PtaB.Bin001]